MLVSARNVSYPSEYHSDAHTCCCKCAFMTLKKRARERATTVQLFDTHDPYLFVANLTSGSMVLANENVNEAALGILAIVFGLILCAPLLVLKVVQLVYRKRASQTPLFTSPSWTGAPQLVDIQSSAFESELAEG